jgi:hypothetical protein
VVATCQPAGARAGKPCWVIEWGVGNPSTSCPFVDSSRVPLIAHVMDDFRALARSCRVRAVLVCAWNNDPWSDKSKPDPSTIFRGDKLSNAGRIRRLRGNRAVLQYQRQHEQRCPLGYPLGAMTGSRSHRRGDGLAALLAAAVCDTAGGGHARQRFEHYRASDRLGPQQSPTMRAGPGHILRRYLASAGLQRGLRRSSLPLRGSLNHGRSPSAGCRRRCCRNHIMPVHQQALGRCYCSAFNDKGVGGE